MLLLLTLNMLLLDEIKINWYKYHFLQFLTISLNLLSTNPTKWSNTLKQFVGKLPANCLSVFDHFVILALKGLIIIDTI